jgi:hypothetical protein
MRPAGLDTRLSERVFPHSLFHLCALLVCKV